MAKTTRPGISNRMSANEEEQERREQPVASPDAAPPPEDAAGAAGQADQELQGQTSHKTGSHSLAQKAARATYLDRSTPQSRKVPGASGREPRTGDELQPDDREEPEE
jgi:hypothetical protein